MECIVSPSTAKNAIKSIPVTKKKLKSDLNTISDLIRDEKYVDLHRIKKMFETLRQEKMFKMVLFALSENNFHEY